MMNCREATRLLSEAQDRPLSFKERSELKFHTIICTACRRFGHQMHSLRHIARAYARGASETGTGPATPGGRPDKKH